MRKAAFAALLSVVSAGVGAQWVEVDSDETVVVHIDPTAIRRDGDLARMRELLDYKTARSRGESRYLSSSAQSEYNCKTVQARTLSLSLYAGNMAADGVVHQSHDPDDWRPVPPGGVLELLWKIACGHGHC